MPTLIAAPLPAAGKRYHIPRVRLRALAAASVTALAAPHEGALSSATCLVTPSLERDIDAASRGFFELLLAGIVQLVTAQAVAPQLWHV